MHLLTSTINLVAGMNGANLTGQDLLSLLGQLEDFVHVVCDISANLQMMIKKKRSQGYVIHPVGDNTNQCLLKEHPGRYQKALMRVSILLNLIITRLYHDDVP